MKGKGSGASTYSHEKKKPSFYVPGMYHPTFLWCCGQRSEILWARGHVVRVGGSGWYKLQQAQQPRRFLQHQAPTRTRARRTAPPAPPSPPNKNAAHIPTNTATVNTSNTKPTQQNHAYTKHKKRCRPARTSESPVKRQHCQRVLFTTPWKSRTDLPKSGRGGIRGREHLRRTTRIISTSIMATCV